MLLTDAIADLEDKFIVHNDIGYPVMSYDGNDKEIDTGAKDWNKAPCGERYILVSSGGWENDHIRSVLFNDQSRAIYWWKWAVMDYAETIAPEAQWSKLHLYWRDRPQYVSTDYIALQQASIVGRKEMLPITIILGSVYSRLLITRKRPDGGEDD